MKKLAIIGGVVLWSTLGFGDWWICKVDTLVEGGGSSIALDSLGYPHIAYNRNLKSQPLYASWNPDSTWTIETIPGGAFPRLKFDSKWLPHIVSKNGSHIWKDTNDVWNEENISPAWDDRGFSFDLDEKDYPHVADEIYYPYPDSLIGYWYKDSAGWHSEIIDTHGCFLSKIVDIEIDKENVIHVVYYPGPSGQGSLFYAQKVSEVWYKEKVDTIIACDWDAEPSIALDTSGYPCIAWIRGDCGICKLKFARKDSTGWNVEIVDSVTGVKYSPALCIDNDNNYRIAYLAEESILQGGDLKYAWFDGTYWNITTVDTGVFTDGPVLTFIDMVVDEQGYSHICYDDQRMDNIQKYARGHGFNIVEEQKRLPQLTFVVYPTVVGDRLNIRYALER